LWLCMYLTTDHKIPVWIQNWIFPYFYLFLS
jgi:hypothetical protein